MLGGLRVAAGWAWLALVVLLALACSALTLRVGVSRWFHVPARLLGRGLLRVVGVRLVVTNGAALAGRRTRVLTFNHTSQLDLAVVASLMPPGGTPLGKKEVFRIPFLGQAWWGLRLPTVDRGNPVRAQRSLARLAERARAERATVVIAPEGTRSRTGELGPFKMGAFHLAAALGAPIVPLVLRGAAQCQPMGRVIIDPGTVVVEVLEELPAELVGAGDPHAVRDELRRRYELALAEPAPLACRRPVREGV